jgi:hypothetical protein
LSNLRTKLFSHPIGEFLLPTLPGLPETPDLTEAERFSILLWDEEPLKKGSP